MKKLKSSLALFLVLSMMLSVFPIGALAVEDTSAADEEIVLDESFTMPDQAALTGADREVEAVLTDTGFHKILHLDCGRKYYTKDWIIAMINEMAADGYTQLQLAFGNDGMRFLLDDMSVTVNGETYSDESVTVGMQLGNKAYYDAGDKNELTEAEMDEIIAHATKMGIEIVPHMNMPGHMDAILDAIEYVGISDAHFTGYTTSVRSLNLNNSDAVAFTQALLAKYVAYFSAKGCKYFHIGADEFGNDAYYGGMGFPNMGSALYNTFAEFVNGNNDIVRAAGMTSRAWNDGISYGSYTASFDTDIEITYWSSGWGGYNVASASTLGENGHPMINTNGDYYYILGVNDTFTEGTTTTHTRGVYEPAGNFDNNTFMGSTIDEPAGAMFCIWSDYPGAETETQVAEYVRLAMRAMALRMDDQSVENMDTTEVPGGFKEDGTINISYNTVTDPTTNVAVYGPELVSMTAVETTAPALSGVTGVKAWEMVPVSVGGAKYTGSAVVTVPVPEGWNTEMLGAFVVNDDGSITRIVGKYADGFYTYTCPHFSTSGVYAAAAQDRIEQGEGTSSVYVLDTDGLDSGSKYLIVYDGHALNTRKGSDAVTISGNQIAYSADHSDAEWTYTKSSNSYYLSNGSNYLYPSRSGYSFWYSYNLNVRTTQTSVRIANQGNGQHTIANSNGYSYVAYTDSGWGAQSDAQNLYFYKLTEASYKVTPALQEQRIGELTVTNDGYTDDTWAAYESALDAAEKELAEVEGGSYASETAANTALGRLIGVVDALETAKNNLVKARTITIRYVSGSTVVKTETLNIAETETSITLAATFYGIDGKLYAPVNTTLALGEATTYNVAVTVMPEDLTKIKAEVEFWITNRPVTPDGITTETEMDGSTVARSYYQYAVSDNMGLYGENGMDFSALVPVTGKQESNTVELWKGTVLNRADHEQTKAGSDDETLQGDDFSRIRYFGGEWAYYSIKDAMWKPFDAETQQIVAYYWQKTEVTEEVETDVVDWGEKYSDWEALNGGQHWFWNGYVENGSKFVFMDFAVVYEDGTQNPAEFPTANTWFYHFDKCSETNPRVIGYVNFENTANYEIWKVTVTDGTCTGYSKASSFEPTYDNTTETIVWTESMGGDPHIDSISYTANRSGKLVRIYVRAVAEDALTVHYVDQMVGTEFYSYDIAVAEDTVFNSGFALVEDYTDIANALVNNSVENYLGVTQYVTADLKQMTEIGAQYRYSNFVCVDVELVANEDGENKDVYLYYTFSPTRYFVADFGLPLTIQPSDLESSLTDSVVTKVEISTSETRFGSISVSGKAVTYTPEEILTAVDGFTILVHTSRADSIEGGADGQVAFRAYIVPATTVYYEESFIDTFSGSGWSQVSTTLANTQETQTVNTAGLNYGYNADYAAETGMSNGTDVSSTKAGDEAEFEFVGNGFEIYANCTEDSGIMTVLVRNSAGKLVKLYQVDTQTGDGKYTATAGQAAESSSLPVVSLQGMTHGTYTVTIQHTKRSNTEGLTVEPIAIDGIRIFNTMSSSELTSLATSAGVEHAYVETERNPVFVELRDQILACVEFALDADMTDESIYTKSQAIIEQVYSATSTNPLGVYYFKNTEADADVITDEATLTDLLDNGPKNEFFLKPGEKVAFTLADGVTAQIGMKAPFGETSCNVTQSDTIGSENTTTKPYTLKSGTDMFYGSVANEVIIENTGEKTVSITLLKAVGANSNIFHSEPSQTFLLRALSVSYEPTVYADAELEVTLGRKNGRKVKEMAEFTMTENGVEGETATFTAEEILAAVADELPKGYAVADEEEVEDVEVVYGEDGSVTILLEKAKNQKPEKGNGKGNRR